ncbi:MAG TPA: surface lipoprotein assembly modifier [Allosphingosinicella sp.]
MSPSRLLAPLVGGAALLSSPLAAQARVEHLSAAELFAVADGARAAGRTDEALAMYEALTHDPDADIRAEARFRKGMTLAERKRYREAARAFRALLDEKPDAARVRIELARLLAVMGDEKAARRELRQAQAAGLPEDVALVVDQFAAALRSKRPYGGSFEVALAPDTNVNRATGARTLDTVIAPLILSEDARARSGLGVKLGGQAYARLPLSPTLALLPRASGVGRFYRAARFDDVSGSLLLGLEWQGKKDRITASAGPGWRWYGKSLYARTQSVSVDWLHPAGRTTQLVASAAASRARYLSNPLQDGAIFDLSLSAEHAFGAGAGATATVLAGRQTARDPGYATASGGVALLGWKELGKMSVYLSATVRRTEGDARLLLFTDRRREWLYQAAAGATFRHLTVRGLAPTARLTFERNVSTVGIYDYRRFAAELGVTRAF